MPNCRNQRNRGKSLKFTPWCQVNMTHRQSFSEQRYSSIAQVIMETIRAFSSEVDTGSR